MEMENKKNCPHCQVSPETLEQLKDANQTKKEEYLQKKQGKEKERMGANRQNKFKKIVLFGLPVVLVITGIIFLAVKYLPNKNPGPATEKPKITVFLSPTCGCCHEYLNYLKREGFQVEEKQTKDMLSIKEKYGISTEMEACHTSVIGNYVVEGHVPMEAIKKLLTEKPEIDGIALPGMPEGAPGMGSAKNTHWKVYQLSKGTTAEFNY